MASNIILCTQICLCANILISNERRRRYLKLREPSWFAPDASCLILSEAFYELLYGLVQHHFISFIWAWTCSNKTMSLWIWFQVFHSFLCFCCELCMYWMLTANLFMCHLKPLMEQTLRATSAVILWFGVKLSLSVPPWVVSPVPCSQCFCLALLLFWILFARVDSWPCFDPRLPPVGLCVLDINKCIWTEPALPAMS